MYMKFTKLFLFVLIFIGLSACTQVNAITPSATIPVLPFPTSTEVSGIEGHVTQGPVCPGPVRIGDTSCSNKPYQATITIQDQQQNQIDQIKTDSNGYFKVELTPGTYILHPEPGKPFPTAPDQTITIPQGQFIQVSIVYDTGIR